jgi:hypothetical protein
MTAAALGWRTAWPPRVARSILASCRTPNTYRVSARVCRETVPVGLCGLQCMADIKQQAAPTLKTSSQAAGGQETMVCELQDKTFPAASGPNKT